MIVIYCVELDEMFSIITPLDPNRLDQFKVTKQAYDVMQQTKEFIIPTRNEPFIRNFLEKHDLMKDVIIIPYRVEAGFNCSKALNLGTRTAKYDSLIITSPEVMPITLVLEQLEQLIGQNVLCKVVDEDEQGNISRSLVRRRYRDKSPAFYFLAMFNKADVEKINGWDEDFMLGYAFEDTDFGERWNRAGLPFIVRDDIQGRHQYHPRTETVPGGLAVNRQKFEENNAAGVVKCTNGLVKLDKFTITI